MPGTISFIKQSFPGKPIFIESDIPNLEDKVSGHPNILVSLVLVLAKWWIWH